MIVGTFSKVAAAVESFSVDYADKLDEGDALSTHLITVPSGIVLDQSQISGTKVIGVVSGGTAGAEYLIEVRAGTSASLTFESEVLLSVLGLTVGVDTLGSLEAADLYHARRGNTPWLVADLGVREAALRRGTMYVEARYSGRWIGDPTDDEQALSWPRSGVRVNRMLIDDDVTPDRVQWAVFEAALREVVSPGSILPDLTPDTQITAETVGPISTTYAASRRETPVLQAVDALLAPYLTGVAAGGSARFFERA